MFGRILKSFNKYKAEINAAIRTVAYLGIRIAETARDIFNYAREQFRDTQFAF
jgi:hypothetical protein